MHHLAIIASDYQRSRHFYVEILQLEIIKETYRENRDSYKLDLGLNGEYLIELFSFPNPPERPSYPEACGLRHLAFKVNDIHLSIEALALKGVDCEEIRIDHISGKKFTFFADPDGLPLELYEI